MAAAIARAFSSVSDVEDFGTPTLLTIFGLTGLVLVLLGARFGLDTSWAFF